MSSSSEDQQSSRRVHEPDEDAKRTLANAARNDATYVRLSSRHVRRIDAVTFAECAELRALLLHDNRLSMLDGIETLTQLETLSLAKNRFTKFPHQVLDLETLTYLNLSNNDLRLLPASIRQLRNLEVLWVNRTGLTSFPEEICELVNLETLGARHNELKSLPYEFSALRRLRWLTLVGNSLSWLPDTFRELQHLKHLNLSSNNFTRIPPPIGNLRGLKYCFLSKNAIRLIDFVAVLRLAAVDNIRRLDLSGNPVFKPESFLLNRFPFLRLETAWFDSLLFDGNSVWMDSLQTSSLDESYSTSHVVADLEPFPAVPNDITKKSVEFLL
ncbi:unnamed protein product [Notodromas monacha]|uniref:Disease resistance R13L4/SHOC-2-like LRR domain-containing protein n=1 Tax=Notodromas monacha TaxID=399045 RepID=A0A7R9BKQ8_9CRUS|nr:unnamed protein product [Notodromas monacha]CAG0917273.1 unnamed protein product [Notodromas monacha]